MDFSSFFHPHRTEDKAQKSGSKQGIEQLISALPPIPTPKMLGGLFSSHAGPETDLKCLHRIPLSERLEAIVRDGAYKKVYQQMFDREIQAIKQRKLAKVKQQHPELIGKIGPKNVRFEEGVLDQIRDEMADVMTDAIFGKGEIESAEAHLLDPKTPLTRTDINILEICLFLRKHNLRFLGKKYGLGTGAFQAMIAKQRMELADIIGEALGQDPRAILGYGVECCRGMKGFDRGEMALNVDQWVAKWLDPKMVRALTQAKKIVPLIGEKTITPSREDILRTQRYQASFKTTLLYYFFKSPTRSQNVFRSVIPYVDRMDRVMQEQMWEILFRKYKVDPDIRGDVIRYMSSFLEQGAKPESEKIMYGKFVKIVPPSMRADVLGHMSFKNLKRYWNAFGKRFKNMPYVSVKSDEETTHMAWHLFHEKELTDEQMKDILKKADPRTQRSFLFSPKKYMDSDLFICMCEKFADSPFYFWQWVRSFRSVHNFKGSLAKIYLTLPVSVKDNRPYVSAMNNHFDLVRECAVAGDTASLSALKKVLGPDVFWQSMTFETEGKISGVRSLCRQGKRGLLKLMADWPIPRQQELFMTTDSNGRTLLDECTGNLARLVSQEVFKQPYQKPPEPVIEQEKEVVTAEVTPVKAKKKTIPRQIIRLPAFEGHMARIAKNTRLVQEVEDAIITLSRMNKAEMAAELREGWKHHGSLDKAPCAVKDIRGNNYRLGYLPRGDTEQGTGQIAILFFLTHAQYNIFLNRQADQAVKVAYAMMDAARLGAAGPSGPAGGNEGR